MKVSVITPRFAVAGVPLAQVRFARSLAAAGHEVDLVIGYILPNLTVPETPGVNVLNLGKPNVRGMLVPVWRYFLERKPDVVFSAEDHLNAIVFLAAILARSKAKISGSCRVTPFDTYSNMPFTKRWVLKQVTRALMWRADALTCVSRDMVDQYREVFRDPRHIDVYNVVVDAGAVERMREPVEDQWFAEKTLPIIVGAGSLVPWKGFGDLIRAVGELKKKGRLVRLVILGEGDLRPELERLVAELGLADQVRLPGHTPNPLKYFSRADAFVLSSTVEGLPNVLVEAMMCGCTPVSTDCPTGPREVLQEGRFGYLVPVRDPLALAAGIQRALESPISKEELAEAVRPFEATTILKRHFELLGLSNAN